MKLKLKSLWIKLKIYLRPFASWKFLISFGSAWIITNGMWYVLAFAPLPLIPSWLKYFSMSYIGFLYLPFTPEKLITIPLAIWIHTMLFRKDSKTKQQLQDMYDTAKADWNKFKSKFKRKKK